MKKCYVIKNKKGEYFCESDMVNYVLFSPLLLRAYFFGRKEYARMHINANRTLFNDCEIIEITIAEGDLEKEFAIQDKMIQILLKDNIEYEQQLIENGIVEGSILSELGYDLTMKAYIEEVEKQARKDIK